MLDMYNEVLKKNLTEKRYNHSVNVSKKAIYLAKKYGADVKKAEIAGLLHDITKQTDETEQLQLISDAKMKLSALEFDNKKLWHAFSGAAYLKTKLNIDDEEILNAVKFHTTGRAEMSLLEKIVFVADMISDDRTSAESVKVKKIAEESLDKAVCLTARFSIELLMEKEMTIAPNTLAAYNDTVKNFLKIKKV